MSAAKAYDRTGPGHRRAAARPGKPPAARITGRAGFASATVIPGGVLGRTGRNALLRMRAACQA